MIPLRDSATGRRWSLANSSLIAANLAVYGAEVWYGRVAADWLIGFAMVPLAISHLGGIGPLEIIRRLMTLVTSLFIHGGWLHIGGNMLYLLIFGPAIEARMGSRRYLEFYLAAGVVAGLTTVAMGPDSPVAVIGASGAIAGVLGAYFVLYPRGRITTILPFISFVEIPAVYYLLVWFALQLYSGIRAGGQGPIVGGIAWWAHVGGFLFGVAAGPLLIRRQVTKTRRRKRI